MEDNSDATMLPTPPTRGGFFNRMLGGVERIAALDVARGLAILGMFTAHMIIVEPTFPGFLVGLTHGRSAGLFAFLAGISIGIIAGRDRIPSGVALLQARMRIVARSLLLLLIVSALSFINMGIALILGFYASWFLLALPFLRMRPRQLLYLAAGLIIVGIPLAKLATLALASFELGGSGSDMAAYTYLISGTYGGMGYIAYIFVGLALARLGLTSSPQRARWLAKRMVAIGLPLFLLASGGGTAYWSFKEGMPSLSIFGTSMSTGSWAPGQELPEGFTPASQDSSNTDSVTGDNFAGDKWADPQVFPDSTGKLAGAQIPQDCYCDFSEYSDPDKGTDVIDSTSSDELNPWQNLLSAISNEWEATLLSVEPHTDSILETTGNLGFSLTVVGLLVLLGRRGAKLLFPLAALGSMALTMYCTHIVWFAVTNTYSFDSLWSYALMIGALTGFACLWRGLIGRGPLERLLHWVSYRASSIEIAKPENNTSM